jgi:hypothetical protein
MVGQKAVQKRYEPFDGKLLAANFYYVYLKI